MAFQLMNRAIVVVPRHEYRCPGLSVISGSCPFVSSHIVVGNMSRVRALSSSTEDSGYPDVESRRRPSARDVNICCCCCERARVERKGEEDTPSGYANLIGQ